MSLDPSTVGYATQPASYTYDWKTLALYALGIGATRDEIDYLYEGRGPRAYPTFAVVPSLAPVFECLTRTGGNLAMVVHGGQSVRAVGELAPSGTLTTTATIRAIYDLKKFAQVLVDATSRDASGAPVYESTWSIVFRGAGGFGGPHPVREPGVEVPKERPAGFEIEQRTEPEQALLYRLSGDENPLHADAEFAANVGFTQGPILHGLCTYGFAARAVVRGACGGDASKLRRFDAQFRRPVWPGDTLSTSGWLGDEGRVAVVTRVRERDEAVLGQCWAEIA